MSSTATTSQAAQAMYQRMYPSGVMKEGENANIRIQRALQETAATQGQQATQGQRKRKNRKSRKTTRKSRKNRKATRKN